MTTGLEAAFVKPIVDALLAIFKKSKTSKLKKDAENALSEAIRELLKASPNIRSAEAKIAVAKAAKIINADLLLAEELASKHHTAGKVAYTKKAIAPSARAAAKSATARKSAIKPATSKKVPIKPVTLKKVPAKPQTTKKG